MGLKGLVLGPTGPALLGSQPYRAGLFRPAFTFEVKISSPALEELGPKRASLTGSAHFPDSNSGRATYIFQKSLYMVV